MRSLWGDHWTHAIAFNERLAQHMDKSYDSELIGKLGHREQRFLSRFGISDRDSERDY
jgi:hypothetical protein